MFGILIGRRLLLLRLSVRPTRDLDVIAVGDGQAHSLTLLIASRFDQIRLKLYAAVDQAAASKHLDDLRLLEPTADELLAAARWSITP